MAADIGTDVYLTDLLLEQFHRGKQRSLGTSGAQTRWPRRDRLLKFGIGCEGVYRFSDALIEQAGRPQFHEFADAFEDNCPGILPCHGQHFFADDFRSQFRLVEMLVERLLDEIRLSFLYHENGPLCGAEPDDLPLDKGVCDV